MVSGQDPMEGSIIQVLQWSKGVHEGLWKSLESFFFEFRLTGHLRRGSQQLRVPFSWEDRAVRLSERPASRSRTGINPLRRSSASSGSPWPLGGVAMPLKPARRCP